MGSGPPPDPSLPPFVPRRELRGRSIQSGLIQLSSRAAQLILLVGSGVLLARLLPPSDFGLVAMVTAVVGIAESVRHFGLPQAMLYRAELTRRQADAVFWRTLELTAMASLAMCLAAPLLALFFDEFRVIGIMLVFALSFAVRGSTAVQEATLMRRLQFGGIAVADVGSLFVSTATGLFLAWTGAGYWALVIQVLVLSVTRSVALWWGAGWRPGGRPSREEKHAAQGLLAYGSDLTRFQVISYAANNIDRVCVGFFSGSQSLGFYDTAYRWSLYPLQQFYTPLTNVALAGLSRVREDPIAYLRAVRIAVLPVLTLVIPTLVFLVVEAERFILVLLGDQWGPAVPLFRVLCIAAVGGTVTKICGWLYLVEGRTASLLRWGRTFLPVVILFVTIGVKWGPLGVAIGYAVGTWAVMPLAVFRCLKESTLRTKDLLGTVGRPGTAAALATAAVVLLDGMAPASTVGAAGAVALLRQATVFVAVATAAWIAMPGGGARAGELFAALRDGVRAW